VRDWDSQDRGNAWVPKHWSMIRPTPKPPSAKRQCSTTAAAASSTTAAAIDDDAEQLHPQPPPPMLRPSLIDFADGLGPRAVVRTPGYQPQPLPPPHVRQSFMNFVDGLNDSERVFLVAVLADLQKVDPL
jgi:hypothetical protein